MGVGRCLVIVSCLAAGGCSPPETRYIGAVDPLGNIPTIQQAGAEKNPKAVPALIGQLDSDDPAIRFYAIESLSSITGQTLDYHYYDTTEQRRPAIERWHRWLSQGSPRK